MFQLEIENSAFSSSMQWTLQNPHGFALRQGSHVGKSCSVRSRLYPAAANMSLVKTWGETELILPALPQAAEQAHNYLWELQIQLCHKGNASDFIDIIGLTFWCPICKPLLTIHKQGKETWSLKMRLTPMQLCSSLSPPRPTPPCWHLEPPHSTGP